MKNLVITMEFFMPLIIYYILLSPRMRAVLTNPVHSVTFVAPNYFYTSRYPIIGDVVYSCYDIILLTIGPPILELALVHCEL